MLIRRCHGNVMTGFCRCARVSMHEMWKEWRCHVYTRWGIVQRMCITHCLCDLAVDYALGQSVSASTGGVTDV